MPIKLGSGAISGAYIGSTAVSAAYLGSTQVLTTGSTDPDFANVVLLLHMDGSDGSTTFTDSSSYARTVTANGNAQVDTAQSKFGGASALFDGSGDWLQIPDSTDFNLGTSDWTAELWFRPASSASYMELVSHRNPGNYAYPPFWFIRHNTNNTIKFLFANSGAGSNTVVTDITTTATLSLNTWHHIAVVRSSGAVSVYIDGVQSGSGTDSATSYDDCVGDLVIGANGDPPNGGYVDGHIDDFRLTIGTARYTSNFTPPTAAFPDA